VESSLWKRLRTCRKTDYEMNERMDVVLKYLRCFAVDEKCYYRTENCINVLLQNNFYHFASEILIYTGKS